MKATIIACLFALLSAGCASTPEEDATLSAADLYAEAQRTMRNANWETAIKALRRVQARYPFDPYALQAHLDMIWVHQEQGDAQSVVEEADRFIKENPRHAKVDYAYYMRGIAYFPKAPFVANDWFNIDQAEADGSGAEKSFQYFHRLLETFPNSEYAVDARARMVWLQNFLARHELAIASWYMRREAYVAAVARARDLLQDYPQSSVQPQALEVLVLAYRKLGMGDLADDVQKVIDANYPGYEFQLKFKPRNERWIDWVRDFFS
jgi:outer membrane protein assembly factor BamD